MSYHRRAIGLLGEIEAGDTTAEVLECEARLGLRLPEAVREWFSRAGHEFLTRYSNFDRGIHPRDFTVVKHSERSLVRVLDENQGVCWWAFELDGSEDPPVYVGHYPSPDGVLLHTATFSELVYVRMFDFGWWGEDAEDRVLLEPRDPLRPASLAWLRANLVNEPSSCGWPTPLAHRFSNDAGRITICEDSDQADWMLAAPTAKRFIELMRSVEALW